MIIFVAFIILITIILAFEKPIDYQISKLHFRNKKIREWDDQVD